MSEVYDGGPAFPQGVTVGDVGKMEGGMSLRDWFAGQALCGFFANTDLTEIPNGDVATNCYVAADYMLRERAKAVRS